MAGVELRRAFKAAQQHEQHEAFVAAFSTHNGHSVSSDAVTAFLRSGSAQENASLCDALAQYAQQLSENASLWSARREFVAISALRTVTAICGGMLVVNSESAAERTRMRDVLKPLVLLHAMIFALRDEETNALRDEIASVCETYWLANLPSREMIATQTFPYAVVKALEPSASLKDVKRVYAMREAIELFDWDDASAAFLMEQLQRCFASGVFVAYSEGETVLAQLLRTAPTLTDAAVTAMKTQMSVANKTVLDTFGRIVARAWRESSGGERLMVERHVIQHLMQAAMLCAVARTGTAVRRVLHVLHAIRRQPELDEALGQLYEPILWRSLRATNALVRRNALLVLTDAFPIQCDADADGTEPVDRQTKVFVELLSDPAAEVRTAACVGAGRVLSTYWEVIKVEQSARICSLIAELSRDGSSADVRAAACSAFDTMLDNHLAHDLLAKALPLLAGAIHDAAPKVRLAMVSLLDSVRRVRGIKYYKVVEIGNILAQLAGEKDAKVVDKLVALLQPGFLPEDKDVAEQGRRVLQLCDTNARAAAIFCANVHSHVGDSVCLRLGLQLALHVDGMRADFDDTLPGTLQESASNALQCAAELWAHTDRDKVQKKIGSTKIEPLFASLLDHVELASGRVAVVQMLARLPPSGIAQLVKRVQRMLTRAGTDGQLDVAYSCLVCMLHWGMLDTVGDQLASAIVEERAAAATPAPAETRKRTKKAMQMDGAASSSAQAVTAESSVVLLDALLGHAGDLRFVLADKTTVAQLLAVLHDRFASAWRAFEQDGAASVPSDAQLSYGVLFWRLALQAQQQPRAAQFLAELLSEAGVAQLRDALATHALVAGVQRTLAFVLAVVGDAFALQVPADVSSELVELVQTQGVTLVDAVLAVLPSLPPSVAVHVARVASSSNGVVRAQLAAKLAAMSLDGLPSRAVAGFRAVVGVPVSAV